MTERELLSSVEYSVLREEIWIEHIDRVKNLPIPEGLDSRKCIVINQEQRIYVLGSDNVLDDMRLAQNTLKVWENIPEDHRLIMTTWWSDKSCYTNDFTFLQQEWAPEITVKEKWYGRGDFNPASCLGGCTFYFHVDTIKNESDEGLQTLIAHEFAHGYAKASGKEFQEPDISSLTDPEKKELICNRYNISSDQLARFLILSNRTLDQSTIYALSKEEQFVDELIKKWGYTPDNPFINIEN